ncbi:MAG: DUF4388 domain-containing protein, partial [Acidobacteriota bacterium]
MGLVGSLEDLSLLDILQIVNVSRRTGLLQIEPDQAPASYIYFSSGAVKDIVGPFDENSFVGFFREQGLVDPGETQQALRLYPDDPGAVLRHLLDAGILNDRLIEQARKQELSYRLKALTQQAVAGSFAFFLEEPGEAGLPGAPTPFWPLNQPVSPQNLLTQTLSEQAFQGSSAPPSAPTAPVPAPSPETPAVERGVEDEDLPFADAVPLDELVRSPSPAPQQRAQEIESATRWQPAKSHINVVLAAAESIFKNMLRQRLLAHYAHVERAESFAEYDSLCRTLLDKGTPFVSVVDLLMPTRDGKGYLGGLEILEHSHLEFPGVKVLVMSDLRDEDLLKITRIKGAAATLPKPDLAQFKVGQLDQVLDEFSAQLCRSIDDLVPPVEEEVAEFFKDLGAESVGEGYRIRDQLGLLKGLMGELARPQETPEISLLVLRLASEYFERAVLFLVKRTQIVGLGGFG